MALTRLLSSGQVTPNIRRAIIAARLSKLANGRETERATIAGIDYDDDGRPVKL